MIPRNLSSSGGAANGGWNELGSGAGAAERLLSWVTMVTLDLGKAGGLMFWA